MRRSSARHSASARAGRTALTRQVFWVVMIGVASTVTQALLYWALRHAPCRDSPHPEGRGRVDGQDDVGHCVLLAFRVCARTAPRHPLYWDQG